MNADAILAGLHARLKTVTGLRAILDYEPESVQAAPFLYSLLDETARPLPAGQQQSVRYRYLHRVVIDWTDPAAAERLVRRYTDAIPNAIAADPTLGGVVTRGFASVVDQAAGFVVINKVLVRVLDSYSETLVKRAAQ